jgi:hypothetical protein
MSLCRNVKAAAGAAAFSEPAGVARFGFPVELALAMCCMAIRDFFRNVDHVAAFHIAVDATRLGLPPARDSDQHLYFHVKSPCDVWVTPPCRGKEPGAAGSPIMGAPTIAACAASH